MKETEVSEIPKEILEPFPKDERSIVKMLLSMTSTAMKLVSKRGSRLGNGWKGRPQFSRTG